MVENTDLICNRVFDYYETRSLMGVYRYGDKLSAIPKIGEGFQMALRTVKAAFARLEENGYVEITHRKATRVIYQADSALLRKNAALYFVPKTEGSIDSCQAGKVLIEPVWEYARNRLDKEAWLEVKRNLIKERRVDLSVFTRLQLHVFKTLQNGLILNFNWEFLRYIRLPYLSSYEAHLKRDRGLLYKETENETNFMRREISKDFEKGISQLLSFCSHAEDEYYLEKEEKIPFIWSVYRQRPQLCYTLVSRIIYEIIKGTYPIGSYLPATREMSEQLGVVHRTLRRALSIMCSLGIISSSQGKVSKVCTDITSIDFKRTEVKEGFRLYRESLQFIELTVYQVYIYMMQKVGSKEKEFWKRNL